MFEPWLQDKMALKHRVAAAQAQKNQLTDTEQPATISLKSLTVYYVYIVCHLCLHCLFIACNFIQFMHYTNPQKLPQWK